MDTPNPPEPPPRRPALPAEAQEQAWLALRAELIQLNGQLEYLRLLLRLGVKPF